MMFKDEALTVGLVGVKGQHRGRRIAMGVFPKRGRGRPANISPELKQCTGCFLQQNQQTARIYREFVKVEFLVFIFVDK